MRGHRHEETGLYHNSFFINNSHFECIISIYIIVHPKNPARTRRTAGDPHFNRFLQSRTHQPGGNAEPLFPDPAARN